MSEDEEQGAAGQGSLSGLLRRARRTADLSQREMAEAAELPKSTLAAAEAGTRDLPFGVLGRVLAVAGVRLALVRLDGSEMPPMSDSSIRDQAGRLFPAHLDTRYGDEDWWHGRERYSRRQPWYTFDLSRGQRDLWRGRTGTPDDHLLPQPGDSPAERAAARRHEALRQLRDERARRLAAGEPSPVDPFTCTCPPECDDLDDRSGPPVHADDCPCSCDVA